MTIKYDPARVKAANAQAKAIAHADVTPAVLKSAKKLLGELHAMHPTQSSQKASLTKAINYLAAAIGAGGISFDADLKTARGLVKSLPGGALFASNPLSQAEQPTFKGGRYHAKDGDALVQVMTSRAFGGAPRPTVYALVNPAKNEYYTLIDDVTGRMGNQFEGPSKLPAGHTFKSHSFTEAQLQKLESEAAKGSPKDPGGPPRP